MLDAKVDLQNEVEKSSSSLKHLQKELEAADARTKDQSNKLNAAIQDLKHEMVS